ncbi:MAG: hypothetical protein ABIP95_06675 [Pelobium sp.]
MNSFFKTLIAGYGAKKLGGGCLSTIVIFVVIYFALGQCNRASAEVQVKKPITITYHNSLKDLDLIKSHSF